MGNDLSVRSSSLIDRLENRYTMPDTDNPFYWYFQLDALGKLAQTKEIVEDAVNSFDVNNHTYLILKVISKKYMTRDLCKTAVSRNGLNLKYVPEQYRDAAMCLAAVKNDGDAISEVPAEILLGDKGRKICLTAVSNTFTGQALSFVPDYYLREKEGRTLCETAVRKNGYALEYVPQHWVTADLAKLAIETPLPVREELSPDGSRRTHNAYHDSRSVLSLVPKNCITNELVSLSVRLHPESLRDVPTELISHNLCLEAIKQDPMNLQYIPKLDREMVNYAVKANPRAILAVPKSLLTAKLCRHALRKDSTIPLDRFPDDIRRKLERDSQNSAFIKYEPVELETPTLPVDNDQIVIHSNKPQIYELASVGDSAKAIYYITDIHLEHQLVEDSCDISKLSFSDIRSRIDDKITELLTSVPENTQSTLLIGGDVADSVELEKLFYEQLTSFSVHQQRWNGDIIAILGNHELWDRGSAGFKTKRSVDDIISDYRQAMPYEVTLLENELFINYKGLRKEKLDEQTILSTSAKELTEVCSKSTFLLLGGIGFSGLNPVYNAAWGLYCGTVSTQEDIARSKRFRAIYEKVLACAKNIPVIILTHTQMANWSNVSYNPKWIYVNGHTHQNTLLLQQDGTAVFSDNQIGYKHKCWHLNSFTINVHRYDLFENYPNGVHQISREQYVEFNRCQSIVMQSMKYPGDMYLLKHNGIYMFILKNTDNLYLLEGGKRHKLNYNIDYYYENLPEYIAKVHHAFTPYQNALSIISDEVKAIGGSGAIHGCIVDIDMFNHVYLNPFDGKVTPYCALNTTNKLIFDNMESLLKSSPYPPLLCNGDSMLVRFRTLADKEKLPILSRNVNKIRKLATVPQIVLDKSMYEPSRVMRSVQYIFDQNVLRVWNDTVLNIDDGEGDRVLLETSKSLDS